MSRNCQTTIAAGDRKPGFAGGKFRTDLAAGDQQIRLAAGHRQIDLSGGDVRTDPQVSPSPILAGIHGLLVVRGDHRGLLLPQVAAERRWSAERFLEETCEKAGLDRNAWRDPETNIFVFTAEVFSEANASSA